MTKVHYRGRVQTSAVHNTTKGSLNLAVEQCAAGLLSLTFDRWAQDTHLSHLCHDFSVEH